MQVQIIFDKDSLDKNLFTGWGISFLIDDKILFDTGENGDWLIDNIKNLKVNFNQLSHRRTMENLRKKETKNLWLPKF